MKKNILVVMGGESTEHDISLITGIQTINSLNKNKYAIYPVVIDKQGKWHFSFSFVSVDNILRYFEQSKKKTLALLHEKTLYLKNKNRLKKLCDIDCGILCCHGGNGENGALQGLFEGYKVPIVSPGHTSSGVFMDKYLAKILFEKLGIKTTPFVKVAKNEYKQNQLDVIKNIVAKIPAPFFVKPNSQGSSIGVSCAKNKKELTSSIAAAFEYDDEVLVEQCVKDLYELNIAVCKINKKTRLSYIEKPCNKNAVLTFEDKYLKCGKSGLNNMGRELPAKITESQERFVEDSAALVYDNFIKSGVVRIDYLCDKGSGDIFINEVNTIPGSLSFYLWKGQFTFAELLDGLINESIDNQTESDKLVKTFDSCVLRQYSGGAKGSKL